MYKIVTSLNINAYIMLLACVREFRGSLARRRPNILNERAKRLTLTHYDN